MNLKSESGFSYLHEIKVPTGPTLFHLAGVVSQGICLIISLVFVVWRRVSRSQQWAWWVMNFLLYEQISVLMTPFSWYSLLKHFLCELHSAPLPDKQQCCILGRFLQWIAAISVTVLVSSGVSWPSNSSQPVIDLQLQQWLLPSVLKMSQQSAHKCGHVLQVVCPTCCFFLTTNASLSQAGSKEEKHTMESSSNIKRLQMVNVFRYFLPVFPSLRKGRTESFWPCWPDSVFSALLVPIATSATAVVTATGTSSWLAPWRHFLGLSLFLSVCLPLFPSLFFFVFLFALPFPSIALRNVEPVSNLLLPLSEFVFILTAPLPLCSTYRSISLSSLIQQPPHYFLYLHTSSSFCSLPVSKPLDSYLSLLPALPLLSAFQTLPPLVFHFNLIHSKTKLHSERRSPLPLLFLYYFKPQGHFLPFCSQSIPAAPLEANKLVRLQFFWYAFCWAA